MATRVSPVLLLLTVLVAAGCGGSGSPGSITPAGPSAQTLDLTGLWIESSGSLSLQMQQSGTVVTATGSFTDQNAVFGRYAGQCSGTGTLSGSTLTANETCTLTALPAGTAIAGCDERVTTTYTVQTGGRQMVGTFNQADVCNGSVVFTKSGSVTLVKQ